MSRSDQDTSGEAPSWGDAMFGKLTLQATVIGGEGGEAVSSQGSKGKMVLQCCPEREQPGAQGTGVAG